MTADAPTPDFAAARAAMIDSQLKPQGVSDGAVLDAMAAVAREDFVAPDARSFAYGDRAVPIGGGRFLAAPGALGQLLVALAPEAGERALVVGGGSGYSAAVLQAMGVDSTLVESDRDLAARARQHGDSVVEGPLDAGTPGSRDYDLILIDGAIPAVPQALIDQVRDGGRIGGAIVDRGVTRLFVGRKVGGAFGSRTVGDVGVPPLPGFAAPAEFQF